VKRILFFENHQRSFVSDALMWTMAVILHLPQPMLIPSLFGTGKTHLRKAFFIVRAIAAFNDAVSPRTRSPDQRVNSAGFFDRFGKARFPIRVSRVFHRKIHRVIGKNYKKGGSFSTARW
jgi:hypothetical protein